jgi:hypothetical protein
MGYFDPDYREKWAILTQITGKVDDFDSYNI